MAPIPSNASTNPIEVDPNEHIREYLDYYISFKQPPQYAVLLKGQWGIGKTFLIRNILDTYYKDKESKYIYVSLYGLSSFEELDRALRNAIFPIFDNKVAVVGTKVAKAAMGFFKVNSDLNLGDFTSKFKDALYVFDDLERCALPLQKIMGYINEFVEHDSCKVIIIANEDAIKEKEEYFDRREKTVGKVLEVQSSVRPALTYFLSKVEDEKTKAFYQENAETTITFFAQSQLDNLRILQQTLWDFERFYKVIGAKRKTNVVAMSVLLRLFLALSFEVKSGKLKAEHIAKRQDAQLFSFLKKKEGQLPPTEFEKAIERYPDIDLTDAILSDEVLIEMLFKGLIRPDAIEKCLAASHYYQGTAEQQPWRVVWHFMDLPDAEVEAALAKMEVQFKNHEFVIPGEMLHVFGLRLWAAGIGLIEGSRGDAFESNKAYLDYLFENGLLATLEPDSIIARLGGYGGLEMYEKDSSEFRTLYNYFKEKRAQATKNNYPAWGAELLADMQHDKEAFHAKTVPQNDVATKLYNVPVLASIDPVKFVSALMTLQPADQRYIFTALSGRYGNGGLKDRLKDEAPWIAAVHREICVQLMTANALKRARLEQLLKWDINELLDVPEVEGETGLEATESTVERPNAAPERD